MTRQVVFHDDAKQDLAELADWISDRASVAVARGYVARIRDYCGRFDMFSERGARRDDPRPGLRTIGFERRITIAFTVTERSVVILRILYGGRDIDRLLAEEGD